MSPESARQDREAAVQREVTRIALSGARGFALAGSGAIREHGVIERPTEDVDLFTTNLDPAAFGSAVDQVSDRLRGSGFAVEQVRRAPQYARLHVGPATVSSSTSTSAWTGARTPRCSSTSARC